MNETKKVSFLFYFNTEMGADYTLRIGYANEDLTPTQIGTQITKIIGSGAIRANGSLLTALNKAFKETVNEYETLF